MSETIVIDNVEYNRKDPNIGYDIIRKKYDLVSNIKHSNKFIHDMIDGVPIYGYGPQNRLLNVSVHSHLSPIVNKKHLQNRLQNATEILSFYKTRDDDPETYFFDAWCKSILAKDIEYMKIVRSSSPGVRFTMNCRRYASQFAAKLKNKITKIPSPEHSSYRKAFANYLDSNKRAIEKITMEIDELTARLQKLSSDEYFSEQCFSKKRALEIGFIESNLNNTMYYKPNLSDKDISSLSIIKVLGYQRSINYNANAGTDVFRYTLDNYHSLVSFRSYTDRSFKLARLLGRLSIGVEFETSNGCIAESDLDVLGLIPLKDSSVKGYEYATVPFGMTSPELNKVSKITLAKDLHTLKDICYALSRRTHIDNRCSLHVHFGNVNHTKLFLIAFYMLCRSLEDELFQMQPYFKHDSVEYIGSKKNYCKKLPDIGLRNNTIFQTTPKQDIFQDKVNKAYNDIFMLLSEGTSMGAKYNRKRHEHPKGNKWHRELRYSWVNIVNTVFNSEGTIEFRLHSGTVNFQKVMNWILICGALIRFTETHIREIIDQEHHFTLNDIINGYRNNFRDKKKKLPHGEFLANYLIAYIEERKRFFAKQYRNGIYDGRQDIANDKDFVFEYNGVTELF